MSFYTLLCIGCGGFVGAILRGLISYLLRNFTFFVPASTLLVNVVGSFLIGFLMSSFENFQISQNIKSFAVTGILGALTTFSTFTYENMLFLEGGSYLKFALNIVLNIVLTLIFCYIGIFAANKIY